MGFKNESLTSNDSINEFTNWKNGNCQPNFWKNSKHQLVPDPETSCGPYREIGPRSMSKRNGNGDSFATSENHDTIGMIAIDKEGSVVVGTSTNGANHKIPG